MNVLLVAVFARGVKQTYSSFLFVEQNRDLCIQIRRDILFQLTKKKKKNIKESKTFYIFFFFW